VIGFGLIGLLIIAVWSYGIVPVAAAGGSSAFSAFFGADLLVAAAAAAAGALFGFIFGIPRTLDPASRAAVASAASQAGPAAASHAILSANTNLERISDWLTTLLIGATLVQIKDIVSWIGSLGGKLVTNGALTNDTMVPVIVVYFFALSFLGIYLMTRLYLTFAFRQTLAILAGSGGASPNLSDLIQKLDAALKLGTPGALNEAVATYSTWTFGSGEKDDPRVNASLGRVLAKLIASGQAVGSQSDHAAALKEAISKAATDPTLKAQLKAEATTTGQLATGNKSLDSEIATVLS